MIDHLKIEVFKEDDLSKRELQIRCNKQPIYRNLFERISLSKTLIFTFSWKVVKWYAWSNTDALPQNLKNGTCVSIYIINSSAKIEINSNFILKKKIWFISYNSHCPFWFSRSHQTVNWFRRTLSVNATRDVHSLKRLNYPYSSATCTRAFPIFFSKTILHTHTKQKR